MFNLRNICRYGVMWFLATTVSQQSYTKNHSSPNSGRKYSQEFCHSMSVDENFAGLTPLPLVELGSKKRFLAGKFWNTPFIDSLFRKKISPDEEVYLFGPLFSSHWQIFKMTRYVKPLGPGEGGKCRTIYILIWQKFNRYWGIIEKTTPVFLQTPWGDEEKELDSKNDLQKKLWSVFDEKPLPKYNNELLISENFSRLRSRSFDDDGKKKKLFFLKIIESFKNFNTAKGKYVVRGPLISKGSRIYMIEVPHSRLLGYLMETDGRMSFSPVSNIDSYSQLCESKRWLVENLHLDFDKEIDLLDLSDK